MVIFGGWKLNHLKKKKKLIGWTWKTPAFPQNLRFRDCFPIDVLLIKGLVRLAVQVSCSTLSLRTGQDFKKHTAHWDLLCCIFSAFESPPHSSVALLEVQVSQNGSGTVGGRVTFWSGSSS